MTPLLDFLMSDSIWPITFMAVIILFIVGVAVLGSIEKKNNTIHT